MATLNPLYYHEQFLLFYSDKLQWWRHLLCTIFSGIYCAIAVARGVGDLAFLEPGFALLKFANVLIVLLAFMNRVIWGYLFHDPNTLFRFRRPSRGYRRAVYALSLCSVLPSLLLYLPVFVLSSKTHRPNIRLGGCAAQLVLYVALIGLFLWMVNRFLSGEEEGHYEPTVAVSTSIGTLSTDFSPSELSAYSDTLPDSIPASFTSLLSSQQHLAPCGHLDAAYLRQPALGTFTHERIDDRPALTSSAPQTRPDVESSLAVDAPDTTTPSSSNGIQTPKLRCRTIARFDYMPQGRVGPHSWSSWPLVPVVLGSMNTLIFILVCALVHENKNARIPSS
jgi:hypothetical protein